MLAKLFFHFVSGVLGLYLAQRFVPGVSFTGQWENLIIIGVAIGLANFFVKPAIRMISLPLRIITLGLFSLLINMFLIWLIADVIFTNNIEIAGLVPLFWTTLIIWILNLFLGLNSSKK